MVLLRQVPSPYNASLKLFRQRFDCYPSLDSALRDTLIGHLIFARCLHCLPVFLTCVQKRFGKSVEDFGVLAPEWISAPIFHELKRSYGLKSMLETFLRLFNGHLRPSNVANT